MLDALAPPDGSRDEDEELEEVRVSPSKSSSRTSRASQHLEEQRPRLRIGEM